MSAFEELTVWHDAMQLAVAVYDQFGNSKDFGFRDQICRCSVSIPSNIAEGSERGSNKDFVRFLYFALGSCAELRTQLYLAIRLSKCDPTTGQSLVALSKSISAQLMKLIQYRSTKSKN